MRLTRRGLGTCGVSCVKGEGGQNWVRGATHEMSRRTVFAAGAPSPNAHEEEEEDDDAREALHRIERSAPFGDVVRGHRGTHDGVECKASRNVGNAFEYRRNTRTAPFTDAFLDQRRRYHDERGNDEQDQRERHVEEEGAVDLRLERALDGKQRSERSANDFARARYQLVEDFRPLCLENPQHADHLNVRHQ